jgi:hypothetical protein
MRTAPDQVHLLAAGRTGRSVVGTKITRLFTRLHKDKTGVGLPEFYDCCLSMGTRRAFKRALVAIILAGRHDAGKKHWPPTLRAPPFSNRRAGRIETTWLRHEAPRTNTGGSTNRSLGHGRLQAEPCQ